MIKSLLILATGFELSLTDVRRRVDEFWNQFQSVSYTESVTQVRLGPNNKPREQRVSSYESLTLLQLNGSGLAVDESRVQQGKIAGPPARPLLTSAGFATLLLILHPHYALSYEFTELPDQDGLRRVRFAHVKGSRTPSVLQVRGRDFPLEWQGIVWLEPGTARAVRVSASLGGPMEDIGLARLEADVRYGSVTFTHPDETFWLPVSATVDAETRRQHWRNIHQFTKYRRFTVDTNVKIAAPQQ